MPTEASGPIYTISDRKCGRGLAVSSPEWPWALSGKWEELSTIPARPNQFPWRRWA